MSKVLNEYYEMYKEKIVSFNQKIIHELGLIPDQISFKCGGFKFPCILYSSSMEEARLIAVLREENFKLIDDQNKRVFLTFAFKQQGTNRQIGFFINSRIKSMGKYECDRPDLYFLQLEYLNRPSDDLIQILGSHLSRMASDQKRMEERITFKSDDDKLLGIDSMQNILYNAGQGKKCILTEISIFSAKVIIEGKSNEYKPQAKVMLVMKAKGLEGIGEMMGFIERVESINSDKGIFSLIITFDQENIPPSYKMWIAECIETIKVHPEAKN